MINGKGTKAKLMKPKVERAQGGVRPLNISRMKMGIMPAQARRKQAMAVRAERMAWGWKASKKNETIDC